MKKVLLVSLLFVMVLGSSSVFAAEKVPLGAGNLALKVDYINFTDADTENFDVGSGLYVGLEAYSHLVDSAPNFYIGMEVGYTNIDGDMDNSDSNHETEASFVPIELNLKYAMNVVPNLELDLGAGASINYAKIQVPGTGDDWLWGAQIFADLNYKINQFFLGINAKYQMMENFDDTDISFRNWRFGGQAGIMF